MALFARTSLGIDVLEHEKFKSLEGRNIALITNHTGLNAHGVSTVELLSKSKSCRLVRILTPEHGFLGTAEHGEKVSDSIDPKTGTPVLSLYGKNMRPNDEMLKDVDTIVFDIQDIGVRFYTYITTMGMALEEAAKRKIRFVVLDRPNPLRGDQMEGDVLDPDIKRMTGYFQIPTRHGITVGELASWLNETGELGADLQIIKMKNWKRSFWFDQTGLTFVPPSPNIRSLTAAILYVGVGCFEATNISVGRGTDTPFEIFGAPWIKGKRLSAFLREKNFPGLLVEPVVFTPTKDIYEGQKCEGVRFIVTNRNTLQPFTIFVHAFLYLLREYPKEFKPEWEEIRVVTGSDHLKQAAEGVMSVEELFRQYSDAIHMYQNEVSPYYLY